MIATSILSIAGVINHVDRGSLATGNTTIHTDPGISATRMGVLLLLFSLAYAISQLPAGFLQDRFGDRIILVGGAVLLAVFALFKTYLRARRAASVNPIDALRTE